jgi:hypothetical protein
MSLPADEMVKMILSWLPDWAGMAQYRYRRGPAPVVGCSFACDRCRAGGSRGLRSAVVCPVRGRRPRARLRMEFSIHIGEVAIPVGTIGAA